jgi:hypothetical protein
MSLLSEVHRLVTIGIDDTTKPIQDADCTYTSVVIEVISGLCAGSRDRVEIAYNYHILSCSEDALWSTRAYFDF